MKRQLLLHFDQLRDQWIDSLSQKSKKAVTSALRDIMIAYFKTKTRKGEQSGKLKD